MNKSSEEKPTPKEVPVEAEPMETEAAAPKAQEKAGSQDHKNVIAHLREENEQLKAKVCVRKTYLFFFLLLYCCCYIWNATFSRRFVIVILGSFFFYSCTR